MIQLSFFEKTIEELKKNNIYKNIALLQGPQSAIAKINNKKVINLSSNNYLGLAASLRLRKSAIKGINNFGVGTASVRNIIGDMPIHRQLEKEIAQFKKTQSAIIFQSGFQTNVALINAILTEKDGVFSDELNHASIIDGIRLTKAERFIYPHANMEVLEHLLKSSLNRNFEKKVIITDGVFSMNGDIAPLPDIAKLAKKYNAITIVDDAHGTGVLGKNGQGSVSHFNLEKDWDIQVGTFSKAIGTLGGFVAGPKIIKIFLEQKARPFLFSTSLPPSIVMATITAINILKSKRGETLIKKLWSNTKYFKNSLSKMGFDIGLSQTPITPIIIKDNKKTALFAKKMFELGVFVQGFTYPVVPLGQARIRTIVTSEHSLKDLSEALEKFKFVGKKLKII